MLAEFSIQALPWGEWGSMAAMVLLYLAAIAIFVVGVMGCVLPYPGHAFIVVGCALWAYAAGEPYPGAWLWVTLALLALLGSFADNIFALLGAKRYGCSRAAFWCSALGILVGLFFMPFGLVLGPFLGAFIGEMVFAKRSLGESTKSGFGTLVGVLVGMGVKFVVAGIMLLLFFLA